MNSAFKTALSRVKAEETLKVKTEAYLMETKKSNVIIPVFRKNKYMKKAVAAVCAAVLVGGSSLGAYAYYKTPTSYLSLDINPSVELGVNSFGKIVSAMAYNKDGSTILTGQNLTNYSVKDAVNALVKAAAEKGFIEKDGSTVISVTSETDSTSTATELQNDGEQGAETAVQDENATAEIQKDNVALARRDEARKLGITPGKLNLIQKLQALDPTITVDQYKDAKVKDIMKKFVELKKSAKASSTSDSSSSEDTSSSSSSEVTSSSASGDESAVTSSESSKVSESTAQASSKAKKNNGKKVSESSTASSSVTASQTSTSSEDSSSKASKSNGKSQGNGSANSEKGNQAAKSNSK